MKDPEPEHPPLIHLGGNTVPCCNGWLLFHQGGGRYACPCGKDYTSVAETIISRLKEFKK